MTIYFSENTVLELKHSLANKKAEIGAYCIVVNGKKNYPKYYTRLIDLLGEEEMKNNFVAVSWDKKHSRYSGAEDGFYSIIRFEVAQNQFDFRKDISEKNIQNNEGLEFCFKCGSSTTKVPGFNSFYTICSKCHI